MSLTGRLLKLDDVLERYRCSRATLYRLISEKKFPAPMKLGSLSRWSESSLEQYEKRLEARGRR